MDSKKARYLPTPSKYLNLDLLKECDARIALDSTDQKALKEKGDELVRIGRYQEALTIYNTLVLLDKTNPAYISFKGTILQYLSRDAEAEECFKCSLKLEKDDTNDFSDVAIIGLYKLGLNQATIMRCEFALHLRSADDRYVAYTYKGLAHKNLGQFSQALACINSALNLEQNEPNLLMMKGVVLMSLNRDSEALSIFNKLLNQDPKNLQLIMLYGITLHNLGRTKEAINYYDKILIETPNDHVAQDYKNKAVQKLLNHSDNYGYGAATARAITLFAKPKIKQKIPRGEIEQATQMADIFTNKSVRK